MTTATVPAEIAHLAFDTLDAQLVQNYCERHCTGLVSHLALCQACGEMYRVVDVERV